MERRTFCTRLPAMAVGVAIARPLEAEERDDELAQKAKIYELQAAFHLAKSLQDIDLLMSLWTPDANLTIPGNPNSPFVGLDSIRALLLTTGSFTHHRFSLVPSFKIQIDVHGEEAFFYEECHDVQDFDLPSRFVAADTYLAGTLKKVGGKWLFWNMFGGSTSPLSIDHYYFP